MTSSSSPRRIRLVGWIVLVFLALGLFGFRGEMWRFVPTRKYLTEPRQPVWPSDGVVRSEFMALRLGSAYLRYIHHVRLPTWPTADPDPEIRAKLMGGFWVVYQPGKVIQSEKRPEPGDPKYVMICQTTGAYLCGGPRPNSMPKDADRPLPMEWEPTESLFWVERDEVYPVNGVVTDPQLAKEIGGIYLEGLFGEDRIVAGTRSARRIGPFWVVNRFDPLHETRGLMDDSKQVRIDMTTGAYINGGYR